MKSKVILLGWITLAAIILHEFGEQAHAQGKAAAIREAAKFLMKKTGQKTSSKSVEQLSRQGAKLVSRFGDDGLKAFRKVGPKSLALADNAGAHADDAIRLLARKGDDAIFVVANPKRLALAARHGDEAADAMIKHGQIVEPVIEQFGKKAGKAAAALGKSHNARRMAIMAGDKAMKPELLDVVIRFGDRGMEFIWKNKLALATTAALLVFISNPEPFIDGTVQLTDVIGEHAINPIAEIPKAVAKEVNWTPIFLLGMAGCGTAIGWWIASRKGVFK